MTVVDGATQTGLSISETEIIFCFPTKAEWVQKRETIQRACSSLGENVMLIADVREDLTDC